MPGRDPPGPAGTDRQDEPFHEFATCGVFGEPVVEGGVDGKGAALTRSVGGLG